MSTISHNANITVNVTLDPSPVQQAGFDTVLLLVDEASGNTLNGARVVTYSNVEEAQTDETAGFISAATLQAITDAFSQRPKPSTIKIGRVDTGAAESYSDALTLVIAADTDFFVVTMDSRTPATQVLLAVTIEAASKNMLLLLQSSDAAWLTAGVPAAYTTLDNFERTAVLFHDIDTEWGDVSWGANRLVHDPDETSAPWYTGLRVVLPLSTAPTETQRVALLANSANLGLPYGGETFFVDSGQSMNTRPLYEQLTADWFAARITEDVSAEVVKYSARGEKIIVDRTGQAVIQGIIRARLQQGEQAGHFAVDQTQSDPLAITAADTAAQRLRFDVRAQLGVGARVFVFNLFFSRDPINDDA